MVNPRVHTFFQNLERNRRHYSLLGAFGPRAIQWNAARIGAGVHFNTAVRIHGMVRKEQASFATSPSDRGPSMGRSAQQNLVLCTHFSFDG
jgi:hypothetical protein